METWLNHKHVCDVTSIVIDRAVRAVCQLGVDLLASLVIIDKDLRATRPVCANAHLSVMAWRCVACLPALFFRRAVLANQSAASTLFAAVSNIPRPRRVVPYYCAFFLLFD